MHDADPSVVEVEVDVDVDVEVDVDVDAVVVVGLAVVVVGLRFGRASAFAASAFEATACGFKTCTAAHRAWRPDTVPHTERVSIGVHDTGRVCADALPALPASNPATEASISARPLTRSRRDLEIDIDHPPREKEPGP